MDKKPTINPYALKPIGRNVVVRRDVMPQVTPGGVVLPDTVGDTAWFGTVVAVGPGMGTLRIMDDGEVVTAYMPMQCKVGDRVLLPRYLNENSATLLDPNDKTSEALVIPEEVVLAILPKAE